jgi:hypothetical protein
LVERETVFHEREAVKALIEVLTGGIILEVLLTGAIDLFSTDGTMQFLLLLLAVLLFFVGISDFGFSMGMREQLRRWKASRRALGWQLAVFVAGIIAFPTAWFIASYPADLVYTSVAGIYTFTGIAATAISIVRTLIGLLVGLALFFLIIWLWVNSNRRNDPYA